MQLPRNWREVKLWQYQELFEIEAMDLTSLEKTIEQIAVLLNIPPDDEFLENMDTDELFETINTVSWLRTTPPLNFENKINDLEFKPLDKLTLGEFIDVEHYMSDPLNNMHTVLAILYKRTREDEWGNKHFEPHIYDLASRADVFRDSPVASVWGVFESYKTWKEKFTQVYENLFEPPVDEDEEELEGLNMIERAEIIKEQKAQARKKRWSWESILWGLSDGDVTKYDTLFNLPVILVFNTLSMRKDLGLDKSQ